MTGKCLIPSRVRKGFKCYCGKSYKTSQGLKNHSMLVHNTTTTTEILNNNSHSSSPNGSSNGGSNTNNSNNNSNQSLSPNNNNNGIAVTTLANLSVASNDDSSSSVAMQTNQNKQNISTSTVPQTFNLITLKTISTANGLTNSHAISSTHNPNKLVKINSDCFDGTLVNNKTSVKSLILGSENNRNNSNILESSLTVISNRSSNGDSTSVKTNLPSLGMCQLIY